ncbi:MAG: ATP-binding cassette domain-containing protein [Pseudomonadota bacterium]
MDQRATAAIDDSRHSAADPDTGSFARIGRLVDSQGRANSRFPANPYAAVVEAILATHGINPASTPEQLARLRGAGSVDEACATTHLRTRSVVLRPGWWSADHGHMVGWLAAPEGFNGDKIPVALIREPTGGYTLVRPDTGRRSKLTAKLAAAIAVDAVEVYPTFPRALATIGGLARYILPTIAPELKWAVVIGGLTSLLAAGLPVATGFVIDTIIPGAEGRLLLEIGTGLAFAALIMAVLQMISARLLLRIEGRTDILVQSALWDHVLRLPASVHRRYASGDLQTRIDAVDTVRTTIVSSVLTTTLTATFSVFYLALLFVYDVRLAWFAVGYVVVLTIASIGVALYLKRFYRRQAEVSGWLNGYVFQMLQAVVKLRSARAEGRALSRWADSYADWLELDLRTQRVSGVFASLTGLYAAAGLIAIYAITARFSTETLSTGAFIAFLAAFGGFQAAFQGVSDTIVQWLSITPLWERARDVLEEAREDAEDAGDPGELSGAIDIVNLSFGYDEGAPILKNINIQIRSGEHVAFVGPSGSGKSTILRLLMALETPDNGSISYDNQDLQGLDPALVRRQLGVVIQDGKISAGSIMDNVRGATDLSYEACMDACIAAGLEADLKQFPMGLHTVLTEGGATLSGGQRQRILIARALAGNPRILVLDEATSALDNTTQAVVTRSIEALSLTRITVAHRLSTIADADRVYVLDEGRVVQEGAPTELKQTDGLFADLARRQMLSDGER